MSQRSFSSPDEIQSGVIYSRTQSRAACGSYFQSSGSSWVGRSRGLYRGANTPDFKRKLANKEFLPVNSYYRQDYRATRPWGSAVVKHLTPWCSSNTQTNNHFDIQPVAIMEPSGDAVPPSLIPYCGDPDWEQMLIAAIGDISPELDLGTTLAEAHSTIGMVLNARKTAKKLIGQALEGGMQTAKAASAAWLQWRYGWTTLGYDLVNIADALKNPTRPVYLEGRAGDSYTNVTITKSSSNWDYSWIAAGNSALAEIEKTISVDASFRANAYARVKVTTLKGNYKVDIPTTLWELVPYSFVADWFLNVGKLLSAWYVMRTCDILATSIGAKYAVGIQQDFRFTGVTGPHMVSAAGSGSCSESLRMKTRDHGWIPSLVPSITVELNSKRIADAAALLIQRIF